ncbi:MAG: ISAs1 family transposase, partial [Bacteroidales bacterium]|nr:ISAs1 family transposase [Bacteroidales bacterium]
TFNRVFSAPDPVGLEKGFVDRTQSVARLSEGEVVAIDGKSMRGTRENGNKSIVHMVSVWAQENHIVLGQVKVEEKSTEITAIPRLLELLVLKGCIVTIDAMGCQKEIATKIIRKEADYILALKGNHGNLLEQAEDSFRFLRPVSSDEHTDAGHGRVETRLCQVINGLSLVEQSGEWEGLQCLVKVESVRYFKCNAREEKDTRLYITSLKPDAALINNAVRSHWSVENSLHWVPDVAFDEHNSRKRAGFAAQNYSILNRIALNLLKNEKTTKVGVRGKRLKAGWDNKYLSKLLIN